MTRRALIPALVFGPSRVTKFRFSSFCVAASRSEPNWAKAAISLYDDSNADAIVIETNQGGDMCEDTLRNAGFNGRIIRLHPRKRYPQRPS